jgi:hypothetical protein
MNYSPYPVRSFTYPNEQVRADEIQRVIVHKELSDKCAYVFV